MNVFGIGLPEMALIMVVALLIFGPKKLPEIGRSLGKAIRGFQEASKEFENEFKKEADRIEKSVNVPMKATLEPSQKVLAATEAAAEQDEPVADATTEPDAVSQTQQG
ncbi:TatA/E family twin arginine-targeting protein translocase [Oculatella sp. LEGE 06141]|uniref:TatA/E family twin arginine-targeting protein translocase n=1 Tax=Oculatella sp. LEGE 06141 TaxID=1828648 RepID=UPI00187F3AE0|nr:TatA/E family twin arginine-targeting protein translocase [Oculatella sp. LEGE 06141]